MGLTLPNAGNISLPEVPAQIQKENVVLYEFLQKLRKEVASAVQGQFSNSLLVANTISGTSGTFTISSGGSIIVTSGIVITVTS